MTEATCTTVMANLSGTWAGGFLAVAGGEYEAGLDGSSRTETVQRGWYRPLDQGHPRSSADWELIAPWSPAMEAAYAAIPHTTGDEWAAAVRRFKNTCRLDQPLVEGNDPCCGTGHHECPEKVCSKCGRVFCYFCCGAARLGGKLSPDYMECPECGHDWYASTNPCRHCGREIEYGSCRWTDCPGNAGVEDTNYL